MQKNKKNENCIPQILKELRAQLGLTQNQMGLAIGVSSRYWGTWEKEVAYPSEGKCALILKKWGKEIAQIKKQNFPKDGIDHSSRQNYNPELETQQTNHEEVVMLKEVIEAHLRTIEAKDELIKSLKRENELLRGKPTGSAQKKYM